MPRKYAPQTYNVQHFQKIQSELEKALPSAEADDFYRLIGRVTTSFELCEAMMASLLKIVTSDPDLLRIIFSVINARSTRNQVILDLIARHKPARRNKTYETVAAHFDTYSALGPKRDAVAHGVLVRWKQGFRLQPAWHIERKHVAGLPKYHYDITTLGALADEIDTLVAQLNVVQWSIGEKKTKRLVASQKKSSRPEPAS